MNKRMYMNRYIISLIAGVLCLSASGLYAQQDRNQSILRLSSKGFEYEVKAGINIGGTSPLPLPEEIRSIDRYRPSLALSLEGSMSKWFGSKWGAQVALRLENKGMKTDATVKNYSMEMVGKENGHMKGMWTGGVYTQVNNSYLTLPVSALYRLSSRVSLKGGVYASYLLDGDFSGTAYDGYLRDETPVGTKIFVSEATYDFSDDLARFSWGVQAGVSWRAFKHLNVFGDLSWGLSDIFKKDFETITFSMYPIYLTIGFGYSF